MVKNTTGARMFQRGGYSLGPDIYIYIFSNLKYQHINTKGCFKQLQKLRHCSYVDLLESSLDGSWHCQPARVARREQGKSLVTGHWSSSLDLDRKS